jgi:hypothetical protein
LATEAAVVHIEQRIFLVFPKEKGDDAGRIFTL